jgi:hypothetical protein
VAVKTAAEVAAFILGAFVLVILAASFFGGDDDGDAGDSL